MALKTASCQRQGRTVPVPVPVPRIYEQRALRFARRTVPRHASQASEHRRIWDTLSGKPSGYHPGVKGETQEP